MVRLRNEHIWGALAAELPSIYSRSFEAMYEHYVKSYMYNKYSLTGLMEIFCVTMHEGACKQEFAIPSS